MPKNTPTPDATINPETTATVTAALAARPDGLTARKLAGETNLSLSVVGTTLAQLETAGVAIRTPGEQNGNRKGADVWTLAAPVTTDATDSDATDSDATENTSASDTASVDNGDSGANDATDTGDATGENGDATAPVSGAPVSGAPVSGGPVGGPDHLKVIMVVAILGDHPDGVSAFDVANESGLRANVVGRVLAAMEAVDVARRVAGESGELWVRGDGDPSDVDLDNVTPTIECPNCSHRVPVPTAAARRGGARRVGPVVPGVNSDGSAKFAKGELRTLVLAFINTHVGHQFNAGTVARELQELHARTVSPGAVSNNLEALASAGTIRQVDRDGKIFTALATPAADEGEAKTVAAKGK